MTPRQARVRQGRSGPLARAVGTRRRYLSGASLYVRTVLVVTLALCVALAAGALNETRVATGLRQQATQTAGANGRLRQDIALTTRQVGVAESSATITREAHRLGYFLPGEPWVVTMPPAVP